MAIEVSLAKFDAIASGDHNAGQIDYETTRTGISLNKTGISLNKVNHQWSGTLECFMIKYTLFHV